MLEYIYLCYSMTVNTGLTTLYRDIYIELVELYTDMCKDELTDEGWTELTDLSTQPSTDMLNLIANND